MARPATPKPARRKSKAAPKRPSVMTGAFVPVRLRDPGALEPGIEHALRVARLLAGATQETAPSEGPIIVVAAWVFTPYAPYGL